MDIVVHGITPYGCSVAALLADAGEDVTIIGPRDKADKIAAKGLTVRQAWDGSVIKESVRATDRLDHTPDLMLFATSTEDTARAAQDAKPVVSDATIATVQYGNKTDQIVARYLPRKNIITCVLTLGASCYSPGDVTLNFKGHMLIGNAYEAADDRLKLVEGVMSRVFKTLIVQKIAHYNCTRMLMHLPHSIPAIIGREVQDAFSDPEIAEVAVRLLKEGFGVIGEAGVHRMPLPDFDEAALKEFLAAPIKEAVARFSGIAVGLGKARCVGPVLGSILQGEFSEIDYLNGEVVNIGEMLDRPAPLNALMVELVHRVEAGGGFLGRDEFLGLVRDRISNAP